MKKRKFILIFTVIAMLIAISTVYDATVDTYSLIEKSGKSYIEINDKKYVFTNEHWKFKELGDRIGFLEGEPDHAKILYLPFCHGIYSLKNDNDAMFYQIMEAVACKDRVLLMREDIDLKPPIAEEIDYIVFNNNIIQNEDTITELMNIYNTSPVEKNVRNFATHNTLQVNFKKYQSVYLQINIYYSSTMDAWFMESENYKYLLIPNDLIEKLNIT